MKNNRIIVFSVSMMLLSLLTATAGATSYTFSATDGYRSASATFSAEGQNLYVTLSNNTVGDSYAPTDVLTAILFNYNGVLTPVNATVASGSAVYQTGSTTPINVTDVGGEWAYKSGITGAPGGATNGISSSGLGIFGEKDRFNTAPSANLSGQEAPDGLQYGISSKGDNILTGNGDVMGTPLIKNAVKFLLTGVSIIPDPRYAITNVEFIFGTSPDVFIAPPTDTVPEPSSLALLLLGSVGILYSIRRRKA